MAYSVMHSFTIDFSRAGGMDRETMRNKIIGIIRVMSDEDGMKKPNIGGDDGDPNHCMSRELTAQKGHVVVLAGIFNHWHFDQASEFARRLSVSLDTVILHASLDLEIDHGVAQSQAWRCGVKLEGQECYA